MTQFEMRQHKLKPPLEKEIEQSILDYLALRGIFAWKIQSVGVFDTKKKVFRRTPRRFTPGVSDILGIYRGRPIAIEVKRPGGKPSLAQREFLERFNREGGIGFIARSVEEVDLKLKGIDLPSGVAG